MVPLHVCTGSLCRWCWVPSWVCTPGSGLWAPGWPVGSGGPQRKPGIAEVGPTVSKGASRTGGTEGGRRQREPDGVGSGRGPEAVGGARYQDSGLEGCGRDQDTLAVAERNGDIGFGGRSRSWSLYGMRSCSFLAAAGAVCSLGAHFHGLDPVGSDLGDPVTLLGPWLGMCLGGEEDTSTVVSGSSRPHPSPQSCPCSVGPLRGLF